MKIKYFILFIAILTVTACAQPVRSEQPADIEEPINTSVPTEIVIEQVVQQVETTAKLEATCLRMSEETLLLINIPQEYCLQYPIGYDVVISEAGNMFMKFSVLNTTDPRVIIRVMPANGMTVDQIADQLVAENDFPGLEVKQGPIEMDHEQAIVLDGLPGESVNRQIVVVHNDRLYHIMILPIEGSPEIIAQAEELYNTIIQSFNFRPDSNICPNCPPPSETP